MISYYAVYKATKGLLVGGVKSSQTCRYETMADLNTRIETIKEFNQDVEVTVKTSKLKPEILAGNHPALKEKK